MSIKITALFDSPDTADIALMNLRANSVAFRNVSLKEGGKNAHVENSRADNYYVPIFVPGFSMTTEAAPARLAESQSIAGLENGDSSAADRLGNVHSDTHGGQTLLEVEVDSMWAEKTKQIFISSHGHCVYA